MSKTVHLAVMVGVLFSQGTMARVIYGEDSRKEVSEATAFQQKLAASAATVISKEDIDETNSEVSQINQRTLRTWLEDQLSKSTKIEKLLSFEAQEAVKTGVSFCEGERFTEQPNPGMCSGFLIAPDLIMTAGHCVDLPTFCSEYRWVFGFQVDPETNKAGIDVKNKDIYKCKKVISNALSGDLGLDYAIVQLDRVVEGRRPLKIRNSSGVSDGTDLVVIGSPSGLPLKVADGAKVRKNAHPFFFSANLDTFQGNSGSAVINAESGVVEGILVRGETDFVADTKNMCIESNKCEDSACRGEDVSRLTSIPEVALQLALNKAAATGDLKTLESILKLNFWVDFYGEDGQSALMKAAASAQVGSVSALVTKGADVNLADVKGDTALILASKAQSLEVSQDLILAGAEKNILNANGETILFNFAKTGNVDAVLKLTEMGVDIHKANSNGLKIVELKNDSGDTLLLQSAKKGNIQNALALARFGADINAVDAHGDTALLAVAKAGNNIDDAITLMQNGANVNAVDAHGETAIYSAIRNKSLIKVAALLAYGAKVSLQNKNGLTPLKLAKSLKVKEIKKVIRKAIKNEKKQVRLAEKENKRKSY